MSSPALERFLAKIYVDPDARARFLAAPREVSAQAGLSPSECEALASIDRVGLEMAARSLARKRAGKPSPRGLKAWLRSLVT
jgi:hypothetical protein